jgi:hypothetical protein
VYTVVLEKSLVIMFLQYVFTLDRWEKGDCNGSSEEHLRNPKPVEVLN